MAKVYSKSPHLKYTMSREEFSTEQDRWNSLTREKQIKEQEELSKEYRKKEQERLAQKKKEQEERALKSAEHTYVYTDTKNTMENSEATIIYIVVMLVGTIFNDRWFIWIVATVIWLSFINRYKIRKKKWDNGGKEEYLKQLDETFKNIGGKKDE